MNAKVMICIIQSQGELNPVFMVAKILKSLSVNLYTFLCKVLLYIIEIYTKNI